jgi:hypothetical protein
MPLRAHYKRGTEPNSSLGDGGFVIQIWGHSDLFRISSFGFRASLMVCLMYCGA